jgi:hypothetical protein
MHTKSVKPRCMWMLSIQPYHRTILHVLASHASFGWIPMPRCASSGETLARGPRTVYPYLTLRTTVDRRSLMASFARLCHRYMESQGLAHLIARFPPVDPRCEFFPSIILCQRHRMRAKSVTPRCVWILSIQPYHRTLLHVLGSHASVGWIPTPRCASSGETLACGPRAVYPYLTLRTTVDRRSFIPSFARLCHRYMESQGLAHLSARFPPVDPRWEFFHLYHT